MKKRDVLVLSMLFISILATSFVLAASNATTFSENAYSCLKNKTNGKISSLSLEEQSFSLMALAYDSSFQSQLISAINDKKDSDGCFPESSCKVKDTAIATIALNYAKQNTADSESWLVDQEIKAKSINVFLEIDTNVKSNCTIRWAGGSTKIQITADKKVSGGGNCFDSGNNGYWLKIKTSCLDDNFTVSCANDFITTLLYQKSSGDLWYVSSDVETASANGETQHVANFSCFSNNGKDCDYEGSLWATLALKQAGHGVTNLIPYLALFASDNSKLFPDTFLYQLAPSDDYLNNIVELQKSDGYWDLATPKGKFYDTALALLVMQSSSDATTSAKSWLQEKQDSSGCWNSNNIRDTAFLLWAGWAKPAVGGTTQENCVDKGFYCISQAECDDASGVVNSNYYCSGLKKCCSKPAIQENCNAKDKYSGYSGKGEICSSGKECSVSVTDAADTSSCCLGSCDIASATTECADFSYSCKTSCSNSEQEASYSCDTGKTCCKPKESGGIPLIVWILLILIIIIVILIVFRNRIKLILFKKRSGVRESGAGKTRPFFPPSNGGGMPRQQYPQRQTMPALRTISNQLPIRQPVRRNDELEETMKKLRDMSK